VGRRKRVGGAERSPSKGRGGGGEDARARRSHGAAVTGVDRVGCRDRRAWIREGATRGCAHGSRLCRPRAKGRQLLIWPSLPAPLLEINHSAYRAGGSLGQGAAALRARLLGAITRLERRCQSSPIGVDHLVSGYLGGGREGGGAAAAATTTTTTTLLKRVSRDPPSILDRVMDVIQDGFNVWWN